MKQITTCLVLASILGGGSPLGAWQEDGQSAFSPRTSADKSAGPLWEIVFADGISTDEYARQLDYFDIQIGAVSKNGKIEYASNVSQYKPQKRLGHADSEYRVRIGWKRGTLHAADRRLLRKAGISSQDKELQHYLSLPLQKELTQLEVGHAGLKREQIRRTRFRIRPVEEGEGYEFVVVEQDPPKPAETGSAVSESFQPSKER